MSSTITVGIEDGIATLTLNRPAKMNAWDAAMVGEASRALEALGRDESVRAVILTGAGEKAFCAGGDLVETAQVEINGGARWARVWSDFYGAIRGLGKPLVAALNGVAAGSGFQVALLTDVRVGHPGVRMGQPEINTGITSVLGAWLMNERLGLSRTIELALTGRMMTADECAAAGLLHHLVPEDRVMAKARQVARELAAKPPIAMGLDKRRFRDITEAAFAEASAVNADVQHRTFKTGEPQARAKAFLAKRKGRV